MTRLGITGTRHGCTPQQLACLAAVFARLEAPGSEIHHGDCVGVDLQAAELAGNFGFREVVHPPAKTDLAVGRQGDERRDPFSYFERNRHIVDECDLLIGVPQKPQPRMGGTWYTIDYAFKRATAVMVIRSNGVIGLDWVGEEGADRATESDFL